MPDLRTILNYFLNNSWSQNALWGTLVLVILHLFSPVGFGLTFAVALGVGAWMLLLWITPEHKRIEALESAGVDVDKETFWSIVHAYGLLAIYIAIVIDIVWSIAMLI